MKCFRFLEVVNIAHLEKYEFKVSCNFVEIRCLVSVLTTIILSALDSEIYDEAPTRDEKREGDAKSRILAADYLNAETEEENRDIADSKG